MSFYKKHIGEVGEQLTVDYLRKNNYHVLQTNFRTRFGEIDIIAEKDRKLVFVEVKTRIGDLKGKPYESVRYPKLQHLYRIIHYYILTHSEYKDWKFSLSVASIVLHTDKTVQSFDFFQNVGMTSLY